MKIYTHLNQQLLNYNKQYINISIDENKLYNIYKHFDSIHFINISNNFKIKSFDRKITNNLIAYSCYLNNKLINLSAYDIKLNDPHYLNFIQQYEDNNIQINNTYLQYYPYSWHSSLVFYNKLFLSYLFIQYLELECNKLTKYISNDNLFNIALIYSTKLFTNEHINHIIYNMINIFYWLNKNKKQINLYILLTPFNKSFTYKLNKYYYDKYPWMGWTKYINNNILYPYNINSGLTYENNIIIFRYEEIYKVFIHECMHALNIDYLIYEPLLQNNLNIYFGKYPIIINEAITEYLSLLYYNFFIIQLYNYIKPNFNNLFKLFYIMISNEIINSAILCNNFFKFYKINIISSLNNKNNLLEQKTNAISYIFIKFILLINLIQINSSHTHINNILIQNINNINNFTYLLNKNFISSNKIKFSLYKI